MSPSHDGEPDSSTGLPEKQGGKYTGMQFIPPGNEVQPKTYHPISIRVRFHLGSVT